MSSKITSAVQDGVARITLDDGKANVLGVETLKALAAAIAEAEKAEAAIVLAGRAGYLSGGLDLKTLPALPNEELLGALELFADVMLRLYTFRRPVVAACTGHALAGGCVMLLTADERYAAEGAFRIGLNETQIGLSLPRFVVEMAVSQLPVPSLKRVVTQGEIFDPKGALSVGLLDGLCASYDEVVSRATARAKQLGELPAKAYGDNKLRLREQGLERGKSSYSKEIEAFMSFFRPLSR